MMSEVLTLMSSELQKKRKISAEKLFEKKMACLKLTNWGENINLSKVQSG